MHDELDQRGVRLVLCELTRDVRAELGRFETLDLLGPDAVQDTVGDVVAAHRQSLGRGPSAPGPGQPA